MAANWSKIDFFRQYRLYHQDPEALAKFMANYNIAALPITAWIDEIKQILEQEINDAFLALKLQLAEPAVEVDLFAPMFAQLSINTSLPLTEADSAWLNNLLQSVACTVTDISVYTHLSTIIATNYPTLHKLAEKLALYNASKTLPIISQELTNLGQEQEFMAQKELKDSIALLLLPYMAKPELDNSLNNLVLDNWENIKKQLMELTNDHIAQWGQIASEEVEKKIMAQCFIYQELKVRNINLQTVLNNIAREPGVENNSRQNITNLLATVWHLAEVLDDHTLGDFRLRFVAALANNIHDGGGCMAGVAARLFPLYANYLQYVINNWALLKLNDCSHKFTFK